MRSKLTTTFYCELPLILLLAIAAGAHQNTDPQNHSMPGMQDGHSGMNMSGYAGRLPSPHASSGTAWQPASVPQYMWMTNWRNWDLMAHGVMFVTYNHQSGPRGTNKAESANYFMTMEEHRVGAGTLLLRQMFSAEPLTAPHPGFPQLFQTGETYHGQPLVDHQHPHNLFAEPSALYTAPIREKSSG